MVNGEEIEAETIEHENRVLVVAERGEANQEREDIFENSEEAADIDKDAEVSMILVSTRGSNVPNPFKKLYTDNQPPTKQEMENYLHIHPTIKEVDEVQEILQVHYCQYESEEDSSKNQKRCKNQQNMTGLQR